MDGTASRGSISWIDLTVPEADRVRRFYEAVAGWRSESVAMGDYEDFNMLTPSGTAVAGVCHARGVNGDLPPQWLIYITIDDLEASLVRCLELGGAIVAGPRGSAASGRYCVIRDPAGAVAMLYQAGEPGRDG